LKTKAKTSQTSKVIKELKQSKVKWMRLQFCNPFGLLHQFSVPSKRITEEYFKIGYPVDGSSIKGFTEINKSELVLVPDASTFSILPDYFDKNHQGDNNGGHYLQYVSKAARMFVDVHNSFGAGRFSRDSRFIAHKANEVAQKNGFSKSYWSAEIEFFIFDKMNGNNIGPNETKNTENIISTEAPWSAQNPENIIPIKGGYFGASPADKLTDFRDEVADTLEETFGISVIAHHHEVATAGQGEVILGFDELLNNADNVVTAMKTVKEVASKRGMVASFNPKPISNDNGSAMHINQSLWKTKNKKEVNAFYDPADEYAELSQTALYYVGGVLEHAKALCGITNPTLNSYNRLVPGYEAPINIAWGKMNRSACVRIPTHHKQMSKRKRIEYRVPDPTANIYLAEAAILLAGLDGINKKIQPPDPVDVNIYKLSENEKKKRAVGELPTSLKEAISSLKSNNEFLKPAFDKEFIEMYCTALADQQQ